MSTMCPVCKTQNAKKEIVDQNEINFNCLKCGNFKLFRDVNHNLNNRTEANQKISSWISEQNKIYHEYMPYIDLEKLSLILNQRDKTIREKFDKMMVAFSLLPLNKGITLKGINECYIVDDKEFQKLLNRAAKENLIEDTGRLNYMSDEGTLYWKGFTFEGQEYIESLNAPNKNSNKIFMAFWFDDENKMQNIFKEIVAPVIENAGFIPMRVSSQDVNLDSSISDEIIGMIKSSCAVIADCTGHRTAVYYEAGFAKGMKIPVIWTCRKDNINDVCFDVKHLPFIVWDNPEDLANKIVKRLKAEL